MRVVIHNDHGRQAASAEASHRLQRKIFVRSGFPGLNFQRVCEGLQDSLSTPNIAGRALAATNGVFAFGRHGEKGIKGDDPVDFAERHSQPECHSLA